MKKALAFLASFLLASVVAFAEPTKDELTFSATLFNPNDGQSSWAATGEYLVGIGGNFLAGLSISLFDTGPTDGYSAGVAGELGVGKTSGLFVGGALHKLGGDAADLADYTGEARLGVKFGGERGFVKLFASQTWSRDKAGATTDPNGTAFQAGLGLRF